MGKTIIIADNLVNDYCGLQDRYLQNNMHIGPIQAEQLLGKNAAGPLPCFLNALNSEKDFFTLFVRDYYSLEDRQDIEQLERLGNHSIKGSSGELFVEAVKELVTPENTINSKGLAFPLVEINQALNDFLGFDLTYFGSNINQNLNVRFLIIGFHTERRVLSIASTLRNLFGFRKVAVFSHFVASANKEAHFAALQYQFPNHQIQVIKSTEALSDYLESDLTCLKRFELKSVDIFPLEIKNRLNPAQKSIIESICMHWTEANLKMLNEGFSGSALFLANGRQGNSKTEPMVIKIDNHYPIHLEIKGYNLVKDLLGKHVPTLTFPVSAGMYSGVGMELAAMEGAPQTLQKLFAQASNDYALDDCMQALERILHLLTERIYTNTKLKRRISPYRHFKLHVAQHAIWLKENLENIQKYETDEVFVSSDAVINIFDAIRKNNDVINSTMCIAHGDLNLANVITDDKGNLWAIDWTHTGLHPASVDFAKLENDLKFVLTKELSFKDLPNLQVLEEYLLNHAILAPIDELPDELRFVAWDLRFKKLYLPVRAIRTAYNLLQEDGWLIYKVSLLRYALHTLSFDKALNRGECTPPQLWYAFISVEILVFLLVGDDFHLKIRSERPKDYPERFRIPIDLASWKVTCPVYDPPYYTSREVIDNSRLIKPLGETDPEGEWVYPEIIDWGRAYSRAKDGKPLNPSGRTGIAGRGSLWLWGSNPMLFFCPIFYNEKLNQLECLVNPVENEQDIIGIHFRRGEVFEEAMERAEAKMGISLDHHYSRQLFKGYFYDYRQTDNAWVDAKAYLIYLEDLIHKTTGFQWKPLNHRLINSMHPSYAGLLRSALKHLQEENILQSEIISTILEKTG